jgi:hypothetical protein
VYLSMCFDGGVNASGARQKDGPVIPRKMGSGRIVSIFILSLYLESLMESHFITRCQG